MKENNFEYRFFQINNILSYENEVSLLSEAQIIEALKMCNTKTTSEIILGERTLAKREMNLRGSNAMELQPTYCFYCLNT